MDKQDRQKLLTEFMVRFENNAIDLLEFVPYSEIATYFGKGEMVTEIIAILQENGFPEPKSEEE